MAIARKCDRCGKLYEPYNLKNKDGMNTLKSIQIDDVGSQTLLNKIDLCPECCEAFNKWLKDPSTMVVTPTSVLGIKVDDDWMKEPQPDQYKVTCDNSFIKSFEEDE